MIHVMVDIETLGTSANAAIVSIGAVRFDPYGNGVEPPYPSAIQTLDFFYEHITIDSNLKAGREVDQGSLLWWMDPERAEARLELLRPGAVPLEKALSNFWKWLDLEPYERIWSHGSTFDLVILNEAYREVKGRQPWGFRQIRDTRTLIELAYGDERIPDVPQDHKHHPLWDAWRQAIMVQKCLDALSKGMLYGQP